MEFFQNLSEMFNSGDPLLRSWFLVRNNYLPFILCGIYVTFTTVIGPAVMKNREPFQLRIPMIIFNFSIVTTYAIGLLLVAWYLPKLSWYEFCKRANITEGSPAYTLTCVGWVIYVVKYVEFFDTVFFVLRKKNNLITFLHVIHHTLVPLLGWTIFRTEMSGFQSVPILANAIVHVIMYTYYGLAAVGPKFRKYLWWKKYLTQLQMIQFVFIIVFVTIVTPLSGCSMISTTYIGYTFISPLFLYLFYRFYTNTFAPKENDVAPNVQVRKNYGAGENGMGNGVIRQQHLIEGNGITNEETWKKSSFERNGLSNGEKNSWIEPSGKSKKEV